MNATLLGGASVVIAYEAYKRLAHPSPVIGQVVILLAGVGIVGNGLSAWLLHGDAQNNLNMRGAFLHMLGDLMTSVAVLVAGVLMQFKPWHWLDPLLSLCIVAFILFSCLMLLKDAVTVLMNAVPKNLDLEAVRSTMEGVPGVQGVHYLHAWNAGGDAIAFTGHVVVPDQPLSATQRLLDLLRQELLVKFGVNHPVLQLETDCCGNGGLLCELSCSPASAGGHVVERCPHGH